MTAIAFTLAGLLLGSFANVAASRGPALWGLIERDRDGPTATLSRPRSHCPACRRTLSAWELIPVVSYLALRGRCRSCDARIGVRHLLLELLGAAAGLLAALSYPPLTAGLVLCLLLLLMAAAAVDAETGYLPDALVGPALWLGLLAAAAGLAQPPAAAIIGAAGGYGVLRLVGDGYEALRGREGLGRGDAKLLAVGGAWAGPTALPFILLVAALSALAVVGGAALRGRAVGAGTEVRFGPYLVVGIAAVMLGAAARPGLFGRVVAPLGLS